MDDFGERIGERIDERVWDPIFVALKAFTLFKLILRGLNGQF